MTKELEPAEEFVFRYAKYWADKWIEEGVLLDDKANAPAASIVAAAAMVAAVRRFDKSSGRQMRAAIWISIIALLVSITSLIIGIF